MSSSNQSRDRFASLASRIQRAEAATKPKPTAQSSAGNKLAYSRVGFDFMATVMICGFIGWGIDKNLSTQPWGLLILMLFGFIAGVMNVGRALGGYGHAVGLNKKITHKS